ncbi:winged helix-turn-helix domain-containing protein [Bdellovibrio sp. HCB209]|uniref:winged helix-turn-helix domain-containing protein n=1 Tax=Bdellovibrio sp. HCB209 TaxID=3394354 RepID=UPI0039B45565
MTAANLTKSQVRALWLQAQGLDRSHPFGSGPKATAKIVKHLGYVQIDTIHVIERSHHHILYTRNLDYKRSHLVQAQSKDKSVFEYWTHALSYVATEDFKYFVSEMKDRKTNPSRWYYDVSKSDLEKVFRIIKKDGPITIRDIDDDVLVEKDHPWASKKPSKRAMQRAFNSGDLVISERLGMLKKYDITNRHFGWDKRPKAASRKEVLDYKIDRALRSQGVVSLDSLAYMEKGPEKKDLLKNVQARVKKGQLIDVNVEGVGGGAFWTTPEVLSSKISSAGELTHILSPFDPLVIQRKRFHMFFDYDHRFEAYVPKEKRKYGYFTLPVIVGDQAVAVLDLKADRQNQDLLIQQWSWLGKHKSSHNKVLIEKELDGFSKFQFDK